MTTAPKPIRIAIVLNGQEFICHVGDVAFLPGRLPAGGPRVVRHQIRGGSRLQVTILPIEILRPLTSSWTASYDRRAPRIFAGNGGQSHHRPVARFLNGLVCQLQELRQKQEINSGIINSATDAIITINEDHVDLGYNLGAEQMFGYTRAEALGQDLTIIIPPP